LKSSLAASPALWAASTKAVIITFRERPSETDSGPPTPWYSEAPRSLSSALMK